MFIAEFKSTGMIQKEGRKWRQLGFLILFPLFFVVHGVNEFDMDPFLPGIWLLALLYMAASVAFYFISRWIFKDDLKAALASFILMAVHFFFGPLHDFLKEVCKGCLLTRYTMLLPLLLVLIIMLLYLLKKSKRSFRSVANYLNLLFILLLVFDAGQIVWKETKREKPGRPGDALALCSDCPKPDIFLVVADEYAGATQLREQFGFDNSAFEQALGQRGFKVLQNTNANYNFTIHSMASLLNMDYLKNVDRKLYTQKDIFRGRRSLDENALARYLAREGYELYNYSFFNVAGKPRQVNNHYFITEPAYLNRQTLAGRLHFDLGFHIASEAEKQKIKMNDHTNNQQVFQLTKQLAMKKASAPRFVYAHLSLPHHPYYLDSKGNTVDFENLPADKARKAYTEYLQYANTAFLGLIDHIMKHARQPPIIILLSDHGFRQFDQPAPEKYYFMNLNAVYIPSRDYRRFYDGMSNVNAFRAVLNTVFRQQLSMLKDSTIFLKE